jgi:hypothetical protein
MEMKTMTKKTLVLVSMAFLVSCTSAYTTAKVSILGGRSAVPVVTGVIDAMVQAKKVECAKVGKPDDKAYDECFALAKKAKEGWAKAKVVVLASLDQAEAIVRAAESAGRKDVTTWIEPAKKAVCLIDSVLVYLPKKTAENFWLKTVRGFATGWAQCSKPTSFMPENPRQILRSLRYAVAHIAR